MYQALYRKWRPKAFADVIGQEHITETLRRQVAEGRTSHAYLFTGTRGTGKTTCAKILAKAVNCEAPVDGDPCGKCPSCVGIDSGGFLDVLELDAASNNGVDQVRALRDEAVYSPANVKKRVYIVDEVHMLSTAAFNALLKILEEPPEHLMFILATTELHKVPATILSRCQRFSFRRIRPEDVARRLGFVAEQEHIDLRPDGAEILSRLADGALRDGLSLLDQCAAAGGTIDAAAVLDVLGLAGNLQTARLMELILSRDAQGALLLLDKLYKGGKDMGAVLSELSTLTRDLLLRKTAPQGGAALLSGGFDAAALDRLGKGVPAGRFLHLASTLQTASAELYASVNRRLDTELCLLRLCDESLSGDLTALEARIRRLEDNQSARAELRPPPPPPPPKTPPPPPRLSPAAKSPPSSRRAEGPAPLGRTSPAGGTTLDGGTRPTDLRHPGGSPSGSSGGLPCGGPPRQAGCRPPCQAAGRRLVANSGRALQRPSLPHVPALFGHVLRLFGRGFADGLRPGRADPGSSGQRPGPGNPPSRGGVPDRRNAAAGPSGGGAAEILSGGEPEKSGGLWPAV